MPRFIAALAILIGVLIVLVLPDYIGLGIGFSSFTAHEDLTSSESRQFAWLSAYSTAMGLLLGGLGISVLLCFTRLETKARRAGIFIAALVISLAFLHFTALYLASNWVSAHTWEQFISPAERHAWTTLAAALLAVAMFFLHGREQRGSRPAADSNAS